MAYQVLARKYRPQRFADVVGQDHVTVTLMNALRQNRIAHGYIFSGHRGIGKTTIARILAMALNCRNVIGSEIRPTTEPCLQCVSCREISSASQTEDVLEGLQMASVYISNLDFLEVDAATNRGIDEVKRLIDTVRTPPAGGKHRIILLDEAHQLTDAAFNSLLKTLEEPPPWAVFMMATTQPEDLPQTVRSRCQNFTFHAVKLADSLAQLRSIAAAEGVLADDGALALLAEAGDGSMRDALSIMDQAIASAPFESSAPSADGTAGRPRLDTAQIRELMGTVPNAVFERILEAVDGNRSAEVMTIANQLLDAGNSPAQLARQCVRYLRNALVARIAGFTPDAAAEGLGNELLQISPDEQRRAARTAGLFSEEELTRFLQVMLRTFDELGYRQEQRFHFELGLLKLVHLRRLLPLEEALSQMDTGGSRTPASTSPPRSIAAPPRPATSAQSAATAAAPARSAFSPFEQDLGRRRPEASSATPIHVSAVAASPVTEIRGANVVSVAPASRAALESIPLPVPVPVRQPDPMPFSMPSHLEKRIEQQPDVVMPAPVFETAAAAVPPANLPPTHPAAVASADDPQAAVVEALTAAKQSSAADAMADAQWTLGNGEATIQTELSPTMLPVVMNAEADKIIRSTLRAAGIHKVTLLSGAATPAAAKKTRPARTGSAHARALEHPMVQQAQKLFDAEIQTVIDLRENE